MSQGSENQDLVLAQGNFALSHPEIGSIEAPTVRGTRLRFPEANQAAPSFVPDHPINGTFTKNYTSAVARQLTAIQGFLRILI